MKSEDHKYTLFTDSMESQDYLMYLLAENVVFINNGYWDKSWPKDKITVHVNCSDVFAWGGADSEDIDYSDLKELYELQRKDPKWGVVSWCIKKRKLRPQEPVEKTMKKAGYDIEELIK